MSSLEPLADPARLRIVRFLGEQGSASLRELAAAAEVHPNTARPHVVELEGAGVLERESGPSSGPGRPEVRYRLVDGWTLPSVDFRGLAEVLGAVLLRAGQGIAEMRAVGLEWGRYLLGRPGAHDVERDLPRALERLGFQVSLNRSTLRLSGCPCPIVLPQRPQLLCELAVAVADGVLAGAGSELRVSQRDHHPAVRSCTARLERGDAAAPCGAGAPPEARP